LNDFLFPPRRASSPVRRLSGGERNRLLLARLFAKPANVLVLDEPTNDLDIESLELLEAALQDYDGTLLIVSHDRAFLDNVITQSLAAEGGGRWREYAGGYTDWLRQSKAEVENRKSEGRAPASASAGDSSLITHHSSPGRESPRSGRVKLNYKEARALEALPGEISALEAEQHALAARISAPDYYRQSPDILRADQARSAEIEAQLMEKLERWEALEAKAKAAAS
jgi:ATP-binding cassette subfamily F protein uup